MSTMPDRAKVGAVVLHKVPEGRTPEHYMWKRSLEREWAGEWTLAKLTNYKFKIGLDPAFVAEAPQFKRGQLHWFEWILCSNGGIVRLYCDKDRTATIWTNKETGEKLLAKVPGAKVHLSSDERLSLEIHFSLEHIHQVCELAKARKTRRRILNEKEKERLREMGREALARNRVSPSP